MPGIALDESASVPPLAVWIIVPQNPVRSPENDSLFCESVTLDEKLKPLPESANAGPLNFQVPFPLPEVALTPEKVILLGSPSNETLPPNSLTLPDHVCDSA